MDRAEGLADLLVRDSQPANAAAAWRRYRTAYPDGILGAEADVSIIETLARTGDGDGALLEANDFLRGRPDGERRAEMPGWPAISTQAKGDCRHTVSAHQITLRATRPRDVVEAAFQRAACLVLLGEAGSAAQARQRHSQLDSGWGLPPRFEHAMDRPGAAGFGGLQCGRNCTARGLMSELLAPGQLRLTDARTDSG